jgi:hypothetical protein
MYARAGAGPPPMLAFFQKGIPAATFSSSGTPTHPTAPPRTRYLECGDNGLPKSDALEHRVDAKTIRQFANAFHRLLTTFTDDVGRAEFLAERNPFRMTTEQDDAVRTQAARRDNAAEPDRAVPDDRHRPTGPDLCSEGRVMAGRHHIRRR